MDEEPVIRADSDSVARLTLNRPAVHNAMDDVLITALSAQLDAIRADESIRAVVLTGAGDSFSAGADLNWMRRMAGYDWMENYHDSLALAEMIRTLNTLPQPTIARINGPAMGGGVGFVACCDIAVACETARFACPEVRLGLIPAVISPYVIDAIGERQARRYFLSGESMNAATAKRLGLVHEVVSADELDTSVDRLADKLTGNAPTAMSRSKALIAQAARRQDDTEFGRHTATLIADQRASDEGRAGVNAFLDRRARR